MQTTYFQGMWLFLCCLPLLFSPQPVFASNDGAITQGKILLTNADSHSSQTHSSQTHSEQTHSEQIVRHEILALDTNVNMTVTGMINRVTVTQTFYNPTSHWVNGEYVFPLPPNGAVDSLTMSIDNRKVIGQIKPKQRAKQLFKQAKAAGKQASLLSQHRPNIFSTEVANISPKGKIVVSFNYQQSLVLKDGEYSLHFPMTFTPRYQPQHAANTASKEPESLWSANRFRLSQTASSAQIQEQTQASALESTQALEDNPEVNIPSTHQSTGSQGKVSIEVSINMGAKIHSINSRSHQIDSQVEQGIWQVNLATPSIPNRDFLLSWQPKNSADVQAYVITQQGKTHDISESEATATQQPYQYQLLMVQPPEVVAQEHQMPRELVLVIDVSGSMSGESIAQAKQALTYALGGLSSQDRFNIIAFNNTPTLLAADSLAVNSQNLGKGQRFIAGLNANGGTEMAPALLASLSTHTAQRGEAAAELTAPLLRQVIFVTDGAVSNEQQLFNLIDTHLGDSRLFTIGIGSAPNRFFMQKAAQAGKGTYVYIANAAEVKHKTEQLLNKIEHPVLTDIQLQYTDGRVPDYWPVNIADLYAGEPIHVAIKSPANESEHLRVSGNINGQPWQQTIAKGKLVSNTGIDLLWANEYVSALTLTRNGANIQRVNKQIEALGMNYHLVTSQTSLIAVDVTPVNRHPDLSKQGLVTNLHPKGYIPSQSSLAGMRLPKTATDSKLKLLIGSTLLSLCLLYLFVFRCYPRFWRYRGA